MGAEALVGGDRAQAQLLLSVKHWLRLDEQITQPLAHESSQKQANRPSKGISTLAASDAKRDKQPSSGVAPVEALVLDQLGATAAVASSSGPGPFPPPPLEPTLQLPQPRPDMPPPGGEEHVPKPLAPDRHHPAPPVVDPGPTPGPSAPEDLPPPSAPEDLPPPSAPEGLPPPLQTAIAGPLAPSRHLSPLSSSHLDQQASPWPSNASGAGFVPQQGLVLSSGSTPMTAAQPLPLGARGALPAVPPDLGCGELLSPPATRQVHMDARSSLLGPSPSSATGVKGPPTATGSNGPPCAPMTVADATAATPLEGRPPGPAAAAHIPMKLTDDGVTAGNHAAPAPVPVPAPDMKRPWQHSRQRAPGLDLYLAQLVLHELVEISEWGRHAAGEGRRGGGAIHEGGVETIGGEGYGSRQYKGGYDPYQNQVSGRACLE